MERRRMVAGNWKMHGRRQRLNELGMIAGAAAASDAEVVLCVPATLICDAAVMATGTHLRIGGQDCHAEDSGAFTGEVSAAMLYDAGASHVIVGHSERRQSYGEADALIRDKVRAALHYGLVAILCIGESEAERDAGRTLEVVARQLAESLPDEATPERVVIAYEPVWAIGSGRTPTDEEIGEVMGEIRETLDQRFNSEAARQFRLLYGGSVTAENAARIFAIPDVDGALVGSASLEADAFAPIVEAAGSGKPRRTARAS